ncbi:putative bifunctional diguanylate cyclase/phosphodiesterase [Sulfuritalea hydrogenivorans]|uniref:PAS domain S-box/diguanylate cyclase (GGDEF) domain-containing protein n=1 Tax=Sulfuritalea hydrogenivorans sk43H TaxID=1223802 RepID=W0SKD5_9PROT|nr:EAL domain-containing protein [Sulfuritalea hydrogenivorans]BAO31347.1 PAS domain S-box/diguanylate cyclase (GGDEF) domain-containing protein [Sulfuritalea hydrogenivorans sk43H]
MATADSELEDLRQQAQILQHINESVISMDLAGFITGWNSSAERLFGYSEAEVIGRHVLFLYADESEEDFRFEDAFLNRGGREMEVRRRKKNGEIFWARLQLSLLKDDDGQPNGIIGFLSDITERRDAAEQLRLHARIFEQSDEAILITDAREKIVSVNPAFTRITGYSADEVIGETPRKFRSGRHDAAFFAKMWERLLGTGYWQGEVWDRRKDGEIYPKWLSIGSVRDAKGEITHYFSIFTDITDRKRAEGRIHHLAYFDALTGLPNRVQFNRLADQALMASKRKEGFGAVLFIDLNRFKPINDTLGHVVGDKVLQETANRFRSCLRGADMVCRLGGDEFAVGLFEIASRDHAANVAHKLLAALDDPIVIGGRELKLGAAIGISIFPEDGMDTETLLRQADIAMYRAKQTGPDGLSFFSEDMNQRAVDRLNLEAGLRRAIDRDELLLHYQPKVSIETGAIIGAEALVRWRHPERGLVPPAEFVPVAEESGLIVHVSNWVLEAACRQIRQWMDEGLPAMHIAVNLSARDFSSSLPARVQELLERHKIGAEWLELEITEGMLMHHTAKVVAMMDEITALGVALSLDDFGTGYSSLSYLKRFPIDTLKIDRSFVISIPDDVDDCAIAGAIVSMSKQLKHNVIAEGVESGDQLAFLKSLGCDEIQGYLFSPPVPAETFAAMVREGKRLAA